MIIFNNIRIPLNDSDWLSVWLGEKNIEVLSETDTQLFARMSFNNKVLPKKILFTNEEDISVWQQNKGVGIELSKKEYQLVINESWPK
jgi:hypothetical protein